MKFTSGPWVIDVAGDELDHDGRPLLKGITALGGTEQIVLTDHGVYPPFFDDALLIAAAPDLYAALVQIQTQCEGHSDEFSLRVWQLATTALAKAEGGAK